MKAGDTAIATKTITRVDGRYVLREGGACTVESVTTGSTPGVEIASIKFDIMKRGRKFDTGHMIDIVCEHGIPLRVIE